MIRSCLVYYGVPDCGGKWVFELYLKSISMMRRLVRVSIDCFMEIGREKDHHKEWVVVVLVVVRLNGFFL